MDLTRMLDKCRRDQWSARDLDWTQSPRPMSPDDERAIVQLFTDMAGIERLAGALFHEQERRAKDPTLKAIFRTFVVDEVRHAQTAQMLADFYDVHRFRIYRMNRSLERFIPCFLNAIRLLSDDVANAYVTGGELILDVALLRSINDYVDDPMSAQAMRLINRDESRHIAVDYHMVEYYASDAYARDLASREASTTTAREQAEALWTFTCLLYYAKPFVRDVFLRPMDRVDPSGARLREAFKRYQLLGNKPGVAARPFGKFMLALQNTFNHPIAGPILGGAVSRLAGVPPKFMKRLYSPEELAHADALTYDALAGEALSAKYS